MSGVFIRVMITPYKHIDIGWPLVPLFRYIADIENNAQWHSEVIHAHWITRNENRVGCTYKEVKLINDEEVEIVLTVSEFIPYQKRTITFDNKVSFTIQFEAVTNDWTRLHLSVSERENNHLAQAVMSNLTRLKNMLEEVYC